MSHQMENDEEHCSRTVLFGPNDRIVRIAVILHPGENRTLLITDVRRSVPKLHHTKKIYSSESVEHVDESMFVPAAVRKTTAADIHDTRTMNPV